MRLGKIKLGMEYVVDLDNQSMVEEAKGCLFEDLMNAVKYDELGAAIDIEEDVNNVLSEKDIPDFLKSEVQED